MAPIIPTTLPVIPLARGTVLLPGIVLRIPVSGNRPDIPALLSNVYSRAASKTPSQRLDNVNIACVPLSSPLVNSNGQQMVTEDDQSQKSIGSSDINPANATKSDLFGYGVAAKISGVEGRGTGEFALLVEGVARIRIDKVTQERPFFEAEVIYEHDDGTIFIPTSNQIQLIARSRITRGCRGPGTIRPPQAAKQRTTYSVTFVCSAYHNSRMNNSEIQLTVA